MKMRNYRITALLLLFGIGCPVFSQTVPSPQNCTPEVTQIRDNKVSLVWNNVEPTYGILDGFEEHEDFAINSPGKVGWSYLDMDNDNTYNIGDYIYENAGRPMAFQIWVPSKTIPAYPYEKAMPHTGNKCLVSMATITDKRNDWLISPDLSSFAFTDNITLSFWARSISSSYGTETVKIAYSLTDKDLSSFTFLNNGLTTEIPASSTAHPGMYYFSFSIPKEARYVAINCVTDGGQALFIDDVAIATNRVMPNKAAPNYLTGFNVYRDGVKVNTALITEHAYTDEVDVYGMHEYRIESVFETGDPVKGKALEVDVPNIHLLPFVETFESYSFETNFWETSCPEDCPNDGCWWKLGFRDEGLIDESAEFYPSAQLKDYSDYCLVSMEFDATSLSEVMLCYDLSLYAYSGGTTHEVMAVEVLSGDEWVKVAEHSNDKGSFSYTRFYSDISTLVAGKKFKIRFNAKGENAYSIISWYIGYVRLYEKAQADVSGTVLCGTEPVEGATLLFTSPENDVYSTLTAADGTYSITGMDASRYALSATLTGYNPYTDTLEIAKGSETVDVSMTRPRIGMDASARTHTLAAESMETGSISLQNTGNGHARISLWTDYADKRVSAAPALKPIKTFNTSNILQAAIGFDGEYFYLARSDEYAGDALIYKYDKENNFLGTFMPNIHVRRYFGMAFDGENFYTANGDNIIRIFNMRDGIQLGEIASGIEGICHITYDEAQDAFWVGSLNTLALVDKNGRTLVEEVTFNSEEVLFSGVAYDPYFKDGPCLWIMDRSRGNNPLSAYTKAVIRRIDLASMQLKDDYAFPCDKLPGFRYGGDDMNGLVWGEGLFGSSRYREGHFVLMGVINANPGLVGIIDMYEVADWLQIKDGYTLSMEADGNRSVSYTVDASGMLENETHEATVILRLDPYSEPLRFEVTANVNAKAPYARPLALTATTENDQTARLAWQAPDATQTPGSYNIYRNGEKIASSSTLAYTDNNLKAGEYTYAVSALYADGTESALSHEAEVSIEVGIACYAPFDLVASNVQNKSIALRWKDPSEVGTQATTLRWDNGKNTNGISGPGDFVAAASWAPQDLTPYRNMLLQEVSFVPKTALAAYSILIYENDAEVQRQAVDAKDITVDEFVTVNLEKAYRIDAGKTLKVGVEVKYTTADIALAIGVDGGPSVPEKGNWIYMRDYGWFTIASVGLSDANFNIALGLAPRTESESPANGFNIYRDGTKINTAPVTECTYSDPVAEPGIYSYSVSALHDNGESYPCEPVLARIVDISAHNAPEDLSANISMNRQVSLRWNYPNTRMSSQSKAAEYKPLGYIGHFNALQPNESAVVTDGQYIYTSHRNRNGEFHKYDMAGNFIETFQIADAGAVTDLTYDGRYFYACGAGTTLYCLDFENRRIVNRMTVTETARHLTYIPDLDNGKGGFELGDWTSSVFVNMDGTFIGNGYSGLDGAYGAAYNEGKLYYAQQGGAGLCEVMELDYATLSPTGNSADFSDSKTLNLAEGTRSGGLDLYIAPNGTATLLLVLQQPAPDLNKIVFVEADRTPYVSGFNLYRDGTRINTGEILNREYADALNTPGTYSYTVSAIYLDGVESPESAPLAVTIVAPTHCEAPVDVNAIAQKRDVRLQWTSVIDRENRGDDLESYNHLASGTVGNWKTIDGDGREVYFSDDFAFLGMGDAKTFFILDQTRIDAENGTYAFSGNKSFVAVAAWSSEEEMAVSNDWMITEAKTSDGKAAKWISFMARGLQAGYKENFYVAYSTMGMDTANFIPFTSFAERVDYLWTRYTYLLPEDATYVAIHYTSIDGRALFIDDVAMGAEACPFETRSDYGSDEELTEAVVGYYIYRNGTRLNTEPINACSFFDGGLANGEYAYEIQALYNTSCESQKSAPVTVKVEYENPCNAPAELTAKATGTNVELSWTEPLYDENKELTYIKDMTPAGYAGFTVASTYYLAQKWDAADLMGVFGYRITAVGAAFAAAPSALSLLIYQGGEVMYEQDITDDCTDMFSVFTLDKPYQIDYSKDLMVAFRVEAEAGYPSLIYTADVPDDGYGNLYSDDGKEFFSVFGLWNGNWFIVMSLELGFPQSGSDLEGYRIYRDGSALSQTLIKDNTYTDTELANGTYRYQVAAVYTSCGEKTGNTATVTIGTGNEKEEAFLISIWPNPAHNTVWISGEYGKLEILDMHGKVRLGKEAGKDGSLDISHLAAGVYFIRIETTGGQQVRKLIVW